MMLKETMHLMREYLIGMQRDLEKAGKGNRTAAQRVRTRSVQFAKIAKMYRKESVAVEKGGRKKGRKGGRKKR